jgi:hypothetical protein
MSVSHRLLPGPVTAFKVPTSNALTEACESPGQADYYSDQFQVHHVIITDSESSFKFWIPQANCVRAR